MKLLGEEIDKILRRLLGKQHAIMAEVSINWDKIVGPKFNRQTSPMRISSTVYKGLKNNILHVTVDDHSISTLLHFYKEIMLERIAVYLGFRAIQEIRITVRTTRRLYGPVAHC